MAVVTESFFALVRARKQLEGAYAAGCWHTVRHWDLALADIMSHAFEEEQRDTKALVAELQKVLNLYSRIVKELPEQATSQG